MKSGAGKHLTDEDRVLWSLVARSARPLKGRPAETVATPPAEEPAAGPRGAGEAGTAVAPPPAVARKQHVSHSLDEPTLGKLAKGRLPIEGRVDLHGLTQSEAHALLLSFLQRANEGGVRYVLVITGKGPGGEGVLRRSVPAWLATPPFRPLVSSYDHAARNHGGAGALYVRLRRHGRTGR